MDTTETNDETKRETKKRTWCGKPGCQRPECGERLARAPETTSEQAQDPKP